MIKNKEKYTKIDSVLRSQLKPLLYIAIEKENIAEEETEEI